MKLHQIIEYEYTRSIVLIDDEEDGHLFVGFVAIRKITIQEFSELKRKSVEPGPSFYCEHAPDEVPKHLLALPKKDVTYSLNPFEYRYLMNLATSDENAFWSFEPENPH